MVERNVIFARRRGIVVPTAAIDANARILRQLVVRGNRTAGRPAAGNGANAVVHENAPAKEHAVDVPTRIVDHPETKNGFVLLARGTARFDNGRTRACTVAAPLR